MKKIPSWYLKEKLKRLHDRSKQPDPIRDWLFTSETQPRIIDLAEKRRAKTLKAENNEP